MAAMHAHCHHQAVGCAGSTIAVIPVCINASPCGSFVLYLMSIYVPEPRRCVNSPGDLVLIAGATVAHGGEFRGRRVECEQFTLYHYTR